VSIQTSRIGILAIAMLAVACGDNASPSGPLDPAAENGSRLVAERWVADGVAMFSRWYDRELEMYCTFRPADDGVVRCLPTDARVAGYVDAQCTQPAVIASTACSDVRFAIEGQRNVVSVGARLPSGFAKGGELPCTRDPDTDRAYFVPGDPVPLDRFVAADMVPAGTVLTTTEYRGEDGSRQQVALTGERGQGISSAVGMECVIRLTGSRTADCTFQTSAGNAHMHYSDDACTIPVIEPQGFPSQITINSFGRPCAPTPLYQVGESRSVPNVFYRDASGACTSLAIIGTMVFDISPIDNANVSLSLEIDETSTSRLRHTEWVTAAGERWPGPLYDTMLDTPCVPRADNIGHARCVPALNRDFDEQVGVSTSTTCEPDRFASSSCWGQSIRTRLVFDRSACGYELVDFEQASGPILASPLYTGVYQTECGPMDLTGAELRDGEYGPVDGTEYVEMRLER
jgi:hypothetical protein